MVLHPEIQSRAQDEIDSVVGNSARPIWDSDIPKLPYLQSIVKETLRLQPPGPLLSWARLAIHDAHVGNSFVPAGTTAMVNMSAITHYERVWPDPEKFEPERFMGEGGEGVIGVMGSDLRLAPFGSGRRVCPGKAMGLVTVRLWLAQLLRSFKWVACDDGNGGGDAELWPGASRRSLDVAFHRVTPPLEPAIPISERSWCRRLGLRHPVEVSVTGMTTPRFLAQPGVALGPDDTEHTLLW